MAMKRFVGGARQLWRSARTLRQSGRLLWFGVAATKERGLWTIPSSLLGVAGLKLLARGKEMPMTPNLAEYAPEHQTWYREMLAELLDLLATGQPKPLVAARVPLAEAARAHVLLERGGYAGKVVLVADS